jgi:hypothetical protein
MMKGTPMIISQLFLNAIKYIAAGALFYWAGSLFGHKNEAWAQSALVSPPVVTSSMAERIVQDQSRAKNLSASSSAGSVQRRYGLEKAQCWLGFAQHEVLRNNPTQVPELAWFKAHQLVNLLEQPGSILSAVQLDSVLLGDASSRLGNIAPAVQVMRKDLWQQLDSIKNSPALSCSAKAVACAEVMLVQAAHAHDRIDWRYAKPYFGMAEDGVRLAVSQAKSCTASR